MRGVMVLVRAVRGWIVRHNSRSSRKVSMVSLGVAVKFLTGGGADSIEGALFDVEVGVEVGLCRSSSW